MKSRVHPTYKTKYRVKNWASYDRALVRRGDVTVWFSAAAIAAWEPAGVGRRGGQLRYSDLAIETALTIRLIFTLPLRQTEGFLTSLFGLMGLDLPAPDHTTLSRRGQHLKLILRRVPRGEPMHLIVDSTGLSIVGEGEWAAAKHGGRGTRGWKKLHVAVNRSGVIIAEVLTEATLDDATTGIDLIAAVDGDMASVTADAAYDSIAFYDAAGARGAQVVVPPTKTARVYERLTLQAALGMRANQSYLVSERNLLVEGVHDYWIVATLSNIFEREGLACLPEDVLITAAGGASEIVPTATFMIGQELNIVALFDSDSAGKEAEEKLRKKWITRYKDARAVTLLVGDALGMPGEEATIEDLFADAEAYYMEKVCESHELKLKSKGLATDAITLSGSGPILPRLYQCFNKHKVDFNKGSVGKLIRRDLIRCQSVDKLPPGVAKKGEALLTAIRAAFGTSGEQSVLSP